MRDPCCSHEIKISKSPDYDYQGLFQIHRSCRRSKGWEKLGVSIPGNYREEKGMIGNTKFWQNYGNIHTPNKKGYGNNCLNP